ncbi:MAG: LPS assembly protein LptD [Campylobacterales bacterium]|nr:LPS assembly protein LptD [Campylobacterales bacterium]
MRNILIFTVVSVAALMGGERVEFIGSTMDANGSLIQANTSPVILYQDQILSANKLMYDQNTSVVEAFGDVNIFKAGQYHVLSDYTWLNMNLNTRYSKPYYMIDHNTGAWMSSDEASGCESKIDLADGILSGCNSTDPLWKLHFSSANYDTGAQWVNIYNARLYIKDVPVMYFPYLGYPTDNTRRSGLLMPTLGLSNAEGFLYQQPIYFAPQNSWDLEFRPQIRTTRGEGVYGDLRFVDSPHSKGSIRLGYFQEQKEYAAQYDLVHAKHYGYNATYTHTDVLKDWFGVNLSGESGLYLNASRMSDVDYLNLQHGNQINSVTANQVVSRLNSYYSSEDNYFGAYIKYYQYLNQSSNAQTIQTVPSLQYHRYLETFFGDHLLINGDATVNNFYRSEGKAAVQGDVTIPLTLQTSLFNDYLDVSYGANGSLRMIGFYGNEQPNETGSIYDKGTYGQLDHTFKMGSTLIHPYETMTHIMNPEVSYTYAGSRLYNGYYETYHSSCSVGSTDPVCQYYTLNEPKDNVALALNNYLFENGKQRFVDRLSQNFAHDKAGTAYGELQNELEWQVSSAVSLYNQTAYNHDRNIISKEQNTVRYNGETISGSISHYYTDTLLNTVPVYASYWTADMGYRPNRYYRFFGQIAYDYHADILKRGEVGFLYTQRCFDFGLRFVQNIRPILTNVVGSDSVNDSYLFITVNLKPLGGSVFNYKLTTGQ